MNHPREIKRNTPIASLIRQYCDKRSGHVSQARQEIRRRFDHLDWKDQKKIIPAMLSACASDRQWAYRKAYFNWHKDFWPIIRDLWEQHHEDVCSWSIIAYAPVDYLAQQLPHFTRSKDYFQACMRLDYIVTDARERMTDVDYLSYLYHKGAPPTTAEADELMLAMLRHFAYSYPNLNDFDHRNYLSRNEIITPLNFNKFKLALFYLEKMGMTESINRFNSAIDRLRQIVGQSIEYRAICSLQLLNYSYIVQSVFVCRQYLITDILADYSRLIYYREHVAFETIDNNQCDIDYDADVAEAIERLKARDREERAQSIAAVMQEAETADPMSLLSKLFSADASSTGTSAE